jgi:anti-anti-sigma factor
MKPTRPRITDVKIETFSTQSREQSDAIVIKMSGNADMAAHDRLKSFLDDVHVAAKSLAVREVTFDVQELYFMNSSCLSLLLRLINAVVESPGGKPYGLRFRSNANLRWQARSLRALGSYAQDIVVVE